jgi:hypothetical protein
MKPKIFISSTYIDMKEFRDEIRNELKTLEIDLNGMEDWGARPENPLQSSLNEVTNCNLYILILGMRYGSSPENENKSYTELEYLEALKLKKEIYPYIIASNGMIRVSNIEFGKNADRLNEFKSLVCKNHTPDYFETIDDLSQKIYKKVQDYLFLKSNRPKRIRAIIKHFELEGELWYAIVGILNDRINEVFAVKPDEDFFPLPVSIFEGLIVYNKKEAFDEKTKRKIYSYYDFTYVNKYGYRTTIEGLDYKFHEYINKFNSILNHSLKNNKDLNETIKYLDMMEVDQFSNPELWKDELKKILLAIQNDLEKV